MNNMSEMDEIIKDEIPDEELIDTLIAISIDTLFILESQFLSTPNIRVTILLKICLNYKNNASAKC